MYQFAVREKVREKKMGTSIKHLQSKGDATVRLMISDKNWLETAAVDQLIQTAELSGMVCGVGLPDLHPGKGQPVGAAFVTRNCIYPHLVGSDIGCGMGLWKLDVTEKKIKLDRWEKKLIGLDDAWQGDHDQWLEDRGLQPVDAELIKENNKLGTIGGGNHFAEIQQVHNVVDDNALQKTGLNQKSVVLLAHSGSRGLGQLILRQHVDRYKSAALPITPDFSDQPYAGNYLEAHHYLELHNYAVKWAEANRALIAKRFSDCLGFESQEILNVPHNTVTPIARDIAIRMNESCNDGQYQNDNFWLHRKGANPTDQGWVMIPGSRGSLSYLVKPRAQDTDAMLMGAFSIAHGAGRKWKRSDVRGRLQNRFKAKDLEITSLGSKVICKSRDLLYEEAPQAYKNIDVVISDMVEAGMIDVIASFRPLITYKTRRK